MTNPNNTKSKLLDITPIVGRRDARPITTKLRVPWFFTSWYEKLYLVITSLLSVYAIVRILNQGLW